jgi:hypothetical protein
MESNKRLNLGLKKIKINTLSYNILYLFFFYSSAAVFVFPIEYPFYKSLYFYLKNLINIQLIPLKSDFIMFYTSTIFILLILTIIIVPIDLIYSYINKKISFFNTKYNILFILTLTTFGIIGIIHLFLLNNLGYVNIIYITDAYLIIIYLIIIFIIFFMFEMLEPKIDLYNLSMLQLDQHHISIRLSENIIYLKERNARIRINIFAVLAVNTIFFMMWLLISYFIFTIIPWYIIILIVFHLYIIFEIIRKKYFLNKETFYQDFYKLSKYFNKRYAIFFGILSIVAVFDILNLFLLKNFTIQIILQPAIIERDLPFPVSKAVIIMYFLCFSFYIGLVSSFSSFNYYLHYFILPENLGYKTDIYEIKGILVNLMSPILAFLSYLALFIVFIINLLL